jgi:hypothetical protein
MHVDKYSLSKEEESLKSSPNDKAMGVEEKSNS